jgi:protein-disulfide isomerase
MSRPASQVPLTRSERRRAERLARSRNGPRPRPATRNAFWRSPIAAISGFAVVAGVALIVILGQKPAASVSSTPLIPTTSYAPGLAAGESLGRADAPVTLEIWSDFQCPFCGQLARTYLPRLVTDFVVGGQLRIVPRDVAFVGRGDPNESVDAAVAASCAADQDRYWQFHDILFWNQSGENEGAFSDGKLREMADLLGLDRSAWDVCRADPHRDETVSTTTSDALAAGVDSTPTLVLNGTRTAGVPRTYDDLANAIRALLPASTLPTPSSSVGASATP